MYMTIMLQQNANIVTLVPVHDLSSNMALCMANDIRGVLTSILCMPLPVLGP